MSVRFITGYKDGNIGDETVVMYDSTTGIAFGPTLPSVDEAELFVRWLTRDARDYSPAGLLAELYDFNAARGLTEGRNGWLQTHIPGVSIEWENGRPITVSVKHAEGDNDAPSVALMNLIERHLLALGWHATLASWEQGDSEDISVEHLTERDTWLVRPVRDGRS